MQTLYNRENTLHMIENFLSQTKMDASYFGKMAVGDVNLIPDLRSGREMRQRIYMRVLKFIERQRVELDDENLLGCVAIKANLIALAQILSHAAEDAEDAAQLMRSGSQNQAIGTILNLEQTLAQAIALHGAAIALHRSPIVNEGKHD